MAVSTELRTERLSDEARAQFARPACFIDGQWEDGRGALIEKLDPATGELLGAFHAADMEQVRRAIAAARRAHDARVWSGLSPQERSQKLHRLVELLRGRYDLLLEIVVADLGTPITFGRAMHVDLAMANFEWFANAAAVGPDGWFEKELPADAGPPASRSLLIREPAGVVGAIASYNFPYNIAAWKLGTALAAGCTAVLLPSPRGTLSTVALWQSIVELDLPPGVVNLVLGDVEAGREISTNPDVDLVTFTGSVEVGARIMEQASPDVKKVILELGGKSANVLLPGIDLEPIIPSSIMRLMTNSGQRCGATSRILVHESDIERFTAAARTFLDGIRIGDPLSPETDMGPLIDERHRTRVRGFLDRALADGATVVAGSTEPITTLPGFYMNPLLLGGLPHSAELCQQEVFGPVGAVVTYRDVDEAVALANDSNYGLNANVAGPEQEAIAVARRIRSGTVTINGGGRFRPEAPWGGYRRSGVGRESGNEGFREFFEVKHVQWPT